MTIFPLFNVEKEDNRSKCLNSNMRSYNLVWKTGNIFYDDLVKTDKHTTFLCRCFITKECFDDLRSTILGFEHLTKRRLTRCAGSLVEPSIMNLDVLKNLFCSQRRRCHGANTNPNILAYSKALNTMKMTEDRVKSSKRNASTQASIGGAHPYNLLAKKSFRQQRC